MPDGYDLNSVIINQNAVRNVNKALIKRKICRGLQAKQLLFDGKGSEAVLMSSRVTSSVVRCVQLVGTGRVKGDRIDYWLPSAQVSATCTSRLCFSIW